MSKAESGGKVVFFFLKQSQPENFGWLVGLFFLFLFFVCSFFVLLVLFCCDRLANSTAIRDKVYLWFGSRKICVSRAEPQDARTSIMCLGTDSLRSNQHVQKAPGLSVRENTF